MKKKVWASGLLYAMFASLICALFMTGCKPDIDTGKTESSWLIGSWSNAASGASFTIKDNFTFEADVYPQTGLKARVRGRLDNSNPNLGPDEYILFDLLVAQPSDPDASYTGNSVLPQSILDGFNGNLVATLTPNENKTVFTFTSSGTPVADLFFGGNYTKQ